MKKTLALFLLMLILTLNACAPQVTAAPAASTITAPAVSAATQVPTPALPPMVEPSADWKQYKNDALGFGFQFPSTWFGPSESVSDQSLRVEVGSDKVYPYGEQPAQPSDVKNSYNVVIQYTKNNQNAFWKDTYQSLMNMKDGDSLSGARNLLIRVRQLDAGRFTGFEYISTLSKTAQTDHVYIREVMLFDKQTNDLITIMGQPNNVDVANGADWQSAYQTIDQANQAFFHKIVESITTG